MKTLLIAAALFAASTAVSGIARAQAADPSPNSYTNCGVPPCKAGVPTAAEGGAAGSGPGDLRTKNVESPVATGAGGGSGGKEGGPSSGTK